jgi:hypothetical protein
MCHGRRGQQPSLLAGSVRASWPSSVFIGPGRAVTVMVVVMRRTSELALPMAEVTGQWSVLAPDGVVLLVMGRVPHAGAG